MDDNSKIARAVRRTLWLSAFAASVTAPAMPAAAQDQDQSSSAAEELGAVVVTGSRIQRQDYTSASPITTLSVEQIVGNNDVTLDTFLNSLPQVHPAATMTSNNPGNGGQSNIDLRGLGSNRNLVLIDGRRPMVSSSDQEVDLNTIPQALIENIEVITGGAGAVYGADAIAGVVNVKLRKNFEGADIRMGYSNSSEHWDSEEYQASLVMGANFADDRGNFALGVDYTQREQLIKSQRSFAAVASSTTTFHPEGLVFWGGGNAPTQAAVDNVFSQYGVAPGAVAASQTLIGFNLDGTLHSRGIFNNPSLDAQNYRYPIDESVNTTLYPDVYTFNFDASNILTLPLERRSFMGKADYEVGGGVSAFTQFGWTEYTSLQALAPTPVSTVTAESLSGNDPFRVHSALVTPGSAVGNLLIVPLSNPFIPADMRTLLASRTGNNPALVGSGADEPLTMRQRTLLGGLREGEFLNTVTQFLMGLRGDIAGDWAWEAYYSEGRTDISQEQRGNIDAQRMQNLLEAADGGNSLCAGGYNPFGRQEISPECISYLLVNNTLTQDLRQQIGQAVITGDLFDAPAGAVSAVLGAEYRAFEYEFDPGAQAGAVSGFSLQTYDSGTNKFKDVFTELLIPLVREKAMAKSFDLSLGYRLSESEFFDRANGIRGEAKNSDAYKAELTWAPIDSVLFRSSYQRAVRAPNFSELFSGGSAAPQYFDPCSFNTAARNGPNAAAVRQLCVDTGLTASAADGFVQTPGGQLTAVGVGNPNLNPEEADTLTFGVAFQSPSSNPLLERLNVSLDYYKIDIKDAILLPTPNLIVAACYNYFGGNPTFDADDPNCQAIQRAGGDILVLEYPGDPDGLFPNVNAGGQTAEGIDLQLDYGFDLSALGASESAGRVNMNLLLNHILSYTQQDLGLPEIDYKGTASYFGAGLGTSAPDWKLTWNGTWRIGDFGVHARGRWINAMENRALMQFPGEEFGGPASVWYWDIAGSWKFAENSQLRIGVNNAFDEEPPTYQPNVQSGTDPSLYDVIGRRVYGQVIVKF